MTDLRISTTADLSAQSFWFRPATERAASFAALRRSEPISRQRAPEATLVPGKPYWAVTTHADVQHVSRNPQLFCSGEGVGLADIPVEFLELNSSFLVMDPPRHTELRRIVSKAFTPRRIAQLDDEINVAARRFVDRFVEAGGGDVVEGLSKHLPLLTICTIMGVPEEVRPDMYRAAEAMITIQDPEFASDLDKAYELAMSSAGELHRIAGELVAARRETPTDDVLSALVHADVDGTRLGDQELGSIFVLFAVAGNDTTRNSTSHGIRLFAEHPDQWQRLRRDPTLVKPAVEEIVRCASPVIHFRRTATEDTEIAGVPVGRGEPVVMFYESANRDEKVFEDPDRFDIGRDPNPHVGFGGGGPHFCLGANLARAELRAVFSHLLDRVEGFEVGPADYLTSNFIHGIKRMPVALRAA